MPPSPMRHGGSTSTPARNAPPSHANLSAEDAADLAALDATIDRMRTFTPTDPYVVTIPQDEPKYHHQYAYQTRAWLDNTPFDAREHESTQYMTWHWQEPGSSMYMLHASRPAEVGEEGAKVRERAGTVTGGNTPAVGGGGEGGPKKTMSLGAYKKKVNGQGTPAVETIKAEAEKKTGGEGEQVRVPAVKKPAVKGPVERLKADEEMLADVEGDSDAGGVTPAVEVEANGKKAETKKDLKRKREEGGSGEEGATEPVKRQKQEQGQRADETRAPNTSRLTPSPQEDTTRSEDATAKSQASAPIAEQSYRKPTSPAPIPPDSDNAEGLPPRLSPLLTSEKDAPTLPSRLSPTLPANMTATLNAKDTYRSVSRSSEVGDSQQRSNSKDGRMLTPPSNKNLDAGGVLKRKSPVPRNGFRANSSSPAVRSDAEEVRGRQPATSAPKRVRSPEVPKTGTQSEDIAVAKTAKESDEEPRRLMVKLKFRKAKREDVRRILRMKPKPADVSEAPAVKEPDVEKPVIRATDSRRRDRRDTNAKGVAQRVGPATARTNGATTRRGSSDTKRSLPEDSDSPERPAKRKKEKTVEPSTPAQKAVDPPATSAQKPTSTPSGMTSTLRKGRELLSAPSMKREKSTDSATIQTPSAMTSQPSPGVNGTAPTSKPTPPDTTTSQRTIKDQPNDIAKGAPPKSNRQQRWEAEQKRLETLGRELKHSATAHLTAAQSNSDAADKDRKLAAIKSLESLLAYMLAFTCADEAALAAEPKLNPLSKPWRSLHGFFGFVKRNCETYPLLLGLSCWLGVVFNARILEISTQHPAEGPSRDSILDTQAMMLRAANEAEGKLDLDEVMASFPKTWKGRMKGVGEAERLEPGGFEGGYRLPLGVQSSPVSAARAGYAMLAEWVEGSGGAKGWYSMKLRLGSG